MDLINLENVRIFVVFLERILNDENERDALKRITEKQRYYLICKEDINNSNSGIDTILWDFNLPDLSLHSWIMRENNARPQEIIYISDDFDFTRNARELMSPCIYIKYGAALIYDDFAGYCPDITITSLSQLAQRLPYNIFQLKGEMVFSEEIPNPEATGLFLKTTKILPDTTLKIAFAGRYFGAKHYLHAIDKFTQALIANKNEKSRLFGKFDDIFLRIYKEMIQSYIRQFNVRFDRIASVPEKPYKKKRFTCILRELQKQLKIDCISRDFEYIGPEIDNKTLSSSDRKKNVENSYIYNGGNDALKGMRIALIDDIVTSGSTLAACASELRRHGADEVVCFALAANQRACDSCLPDHIKSFSKAHHMRFNSKDLTPFYATDTSTKNYKQEVSKLFDSIKEDLMNRPMAFDDDLEF